MDTSRQLLRYSLPGGLFVLVALVFQFATHWAWGPRGSVVFSALSANIVAAVAGVLVIGFAVYQVYYFFYRPVVPFTRGQTTTDRGGAILMGLKGVEGNPISRIEEVYGVPVDFDVPRSDSHRYRKAWHTHNSIVRSLINSIAVSGGEHIKQDFANLSDIYHALGACRLVAPLVFFCTIIYSVVNRAHSIAHAAPARTIIAFAFMSLVTLIIFYTCHANRHDTWWTMTKQLQRDLRIWFVRQPSFLQPQQPTVP